jgi:hypothetical protein
MLHWSPMLLAAVAHCHFYSLCAKSDVCPKAITNSTTHYLISNTLTLIMCCSPAALLTFTCIVRTGLTSMLLVILLWCVLSRDGVV